MVTQLRAAPLHVFFLVVVGREGCGSAIDREHQFITGCLGEGAGKEEGVSELVERYTLFLMICITIRFGLIWTLLPCHPGRTQPGQAQPSGAGP